MLTLFLSGVMSEVGLRRKKHQLQEMQEERGYTAQRWLKTQLAEKRAGVGTSRRAEAECNLSYLCRYRSLKVKIQVPKMII